MEKVTKVQKVEKTEKTEKTESKVLSTAERFEEECEKNDKVLKFLKPGEKSQLVSYVRGPNGEISDVKIRVKLTWF